MRTYAMLRGSMTAEEYDYLADKIQKALLYDLLAELGYDAMKMQRYLYAAPELKKRAVARIRRNKIEIRELEKKIEEIRKENEARAQILFDFCKSELRRKTV